MGPLRSGTTLFMQWLANSGMVAYPTNLLSRFYRAPILGAQIQLLLTDPRYNFRDELGELAEQISFDSENGKTKGVLAPNEFWYFWRRFLPEVGRDVWTDEELRQSMDIGTLRAELAGMIDIFDKPFTAKGMLFNYNIRFLDSLFEKALFIQIRRDLVDNVASVLGARERQLGTEYAWYSFKIPEYQELSRLDPIRQAAGQVCAINRAVNAGMGRLPEPRRLYVDYEDFCHDPVRIFHEIVARLGVQASEYVGPRQFMVSKITHERRADLIRRAIEEMAPRYANSWP